MNLKNTKARAVVKKKIEEKRTQGRLRPDPEAAAETRSQSLDVETETTVQVSETQTEIVSDRPGRRRRATPLMVLEKKAQTLERENARLEKRITEVRHIIEMSEYD